MKLHVHSLLGLVLFSSALLVGCGNDDESGEPAGSGGSGEGGSGGSGHHDCEGRGDPYVAGIEKSNEDETLTVKILDAVPAPPAAFTDNAWEIEVTNGDGKPVVDAEISVRLIMVDHGHGSSKAVVFEELEKGRYSLEPLYFQMAGYWEITVTVSPPETEASAVLFGFCMES